MYDNEVTITRNEYLRLIECEKDANKCGGCGPLAQRDRIISDLNKRITNELSGGNRTLQHRLNMALACISTIKNNIVLKDGINICRKAISVFEDAYERS